MDPQPQSSASDPPEMQAQDPLSSFVLNHVSSLSSVITGQRATACANLLVFLTLPSSYNLLLSLHPTTREKLKNGLLQGVKRENSKEVSKALCKITFELAKLLLGNDGWPDILSISEFIISDNSTPLVRESSLIIFSKIIPLLGDTFLPVLEDAQAMLKSSLSTRDRPSPIKVRIASVCAAINIVRCFPTNQDYLEYLFPVVISTLKESLKPGLEANVQEFLKLLIELVRTNHSLFGGDRFHIVVDSMLQIAEGDRCEEGIRHLAIEFVVTLAKAPELGHMMMHRYSQLVIQLFTILMKMLLEVEDNLTWLNGEVECPKESCNYTNGKKYMTSLSIALMGKINVSFVCDQIAAYLAAPKWEKHHAALITLTQFAGCCSKNLEQIKQTMTVILHSFQDPHPHVRWAAINAVVQLSIEWGPDLQNSYHQLVFPALTHAMKDQHPRIKAHAVLAVQNFSWYCTDEQLEPFLNEVTSIFVDLLKDMSLIVRERVFRALRSLRYPPEYIPNIMGGTKIHEGVPPIEDGNNRGPHCPEEIQEGGLWMRWGDTFDGLLNKKRCRWLDVEQLFYFGLYLVLAMFSLSVALLVRTNPHHHVRAHVIAAISSLAGVCLAIALLLSMFCSDQPTTRRRRLFWCCAVATGFSFIAIIVSFIMWSVGSL